MTSQSSFSIKSDTSGSVGFATGLKYLNKAMSLQLVALYIKYVFVVLKYVGFNLMVLLKFAKPPNFPAIWCEGRDCFGSHL